MIDTNEVGDSQKKDFGKSPIALIPVQPLLALADLFGIGAKKYAVNGWRDNPMVYSRPYSALQRHAMRWWGGEEFDPIDGQHHLIAVAWNAIVLYFYQCVMGWSHLDDRWAPKPNANPLISQDQMRDITKAYERPDVRVGTRCQPDPFADLKLPEGVVPV